MVRGLHRFLLGSSNATIEEFNDLAKRCDVVGRDKAARMVACADLERGLQTALEAVTKQPKRVAGKSYRLRNKSAEGNAAPTRSTKKKA